MTAAAIIKKKKKDVPTVFDISSGFFAPAYCPTKTVTPVVKPVMARVTAVIIMLAVETAEISAVTPYFPTM